MKNGKATVLRIFQATSVAACALILFAGPAGAQTLDADCTSRPGWQLVAAFVLGVFVTSVVALFATRWRNLIRQPQS